jgi:hypothetical protein
LDDFPSYVHTHPMSLVAMLDDNSKSRSPHVLTTISSIYHHGPRLTPYKVGPCKP